MEHMQRERERGGRRTIQPITGTSRGANLNPQLSIPTKFVKLEFGANKSFYFGLNPPSNIFLNFKVLAGTSHALINFVKYTIQYIVNSLTMP